MWIIIANYIYIKLYLKIHEREKSVLLMVFVFFSTSLMLCLFLIWMPFLLLVSQCVEEVEKLDNGSTAVCHGQKQSQGDSVTIEEEEDIEEEEEEEGFGD